MAAFVGPLLGLAGGALGGFLGRPKMSSEERNALVAQQNLMNTQANALQNGVNWAGMLQPTVSNMYNRGVDVFNSGVGASSPAVDYWSRILAGGPEMTAALSPEIQRINAGYTQAAHQASQFAPSGGGRAALMSSLPFMAARDTSNLYSTVRPGAAANLASYGLNLANLGSNTIGQGLGLGSSILGAYMGAGQGAGSTGNSILNYGLNNRNLNFQQGALLGQSLGGLLGNINWGGLFGGGKSSGGGTSGYGIGGDFRGGG